MPCDDRGREWRDASTSQEMLTTGSKEISMGPVSWEQDPKGLCGGRGGGTAFKTAKSFNEREQKLYVYVPLCYVIYLNYYNSTSIITAFNQRSTLHRRHLLKTHVRWCHPSSSNSLMMFTALPIKSEILLMAHKPCRFWPLLPLTLCLPASLASSSA